MTGESAGGGEAPRIRVTGRALDALSADGHEPARSVIVIRHLLGCGGTGFRISVADRLPGDGHVIEAPRGLKIWLDDYAFARLGGAAIDYDTEKETEGYLLDHPDAVFAAFC